MLKDKMNEVFVPLMKEQKVRELGKNEAAYVKELEISIDHVQIVEDISSRFQEAYLERSHKETDETIAIERATFLKEKIQYFKNNMSEFLYIESKWFEVLGIESISLEVDDVFGTYEIMGGLFLKKKQGDKMREFLNAHLLDLDKKYNLMFNDKDGLWDLNLTLDAVKDFSDEHSIGEVLSTVYQLVFNLVEFVEK
ncbi:hypothetical protein [Bacillus weihaiensis]|nr:hypothetical protein [Bacillus weihaiensis]